MALPSLPFLVRERALLVSVLRAEAAAQMSPESRRKRRRVPPCSTAAAIDPADLHGVDDRDDGANAVPSPMRGSFRGDGANGPLQHLPREVLDDIAENFLDSPVWHACKLGEVSPSLGDVFMDDRIWKRFLDRRFRSPSPATGAALRRGSASAATMMAASDDPRRQYGQLHALQARFCCGRYGARGVLDLDRHRGVAVLDLQVTHTGDQSSVAYAALRNGTIVVYDLHPDKLLTGGSAEGLDATTSPLVGGAPAQCARPFLELTPPVQGGPALCCLPVLDHFADATNPPALVAGYSSGGLCAWNVASGSPIACDGWSAAHQGRVCALATLGSGDLVSASADGALRTWSLEGDRFGARLRGLAGHNAAAVSVAASPYGVNIFVSGGHDRTVKLWDVRTDSGQVASWRQQDWVTCVDFHPSMEDCVLSSDKAIHHWDLRRVDALAQPAAAHVAACHRHRKLVSRFRVDPLRLVSCSLDGSVKVSSLERPEHQVIRPSHDGLSSSPAEATLRTSSDYILAIDFDPTRLLAGGVDGCVSMYDFSDAGNFDDAASPCGSSLLAGAVASARRGGRNRCGSTIDVGIRGAEEIGV